MAAQKDELTQLLLLIALAAAPRASHIESEFFRADPTLDPDLPDPEEPEYTDDDYARDVCQRRDGPL